MDISMDISMDLSFYPWISISTATLKIIEASHLKSRPITKCRPGPSDNPVVVFAFSLCTIGYS